MLAGEIAAALDRDWAYEELLRAVTRDERRRSTLARAASQAQALQELTSALSAAVTFEDVAHVVLEHARVPVGARYASLGIVSDDRSAVHLFQRTADGTGEPRWRDFSLEQRTPMTDAARSGHLVVVESPAAMREQYPEIAEPVLRTGLSATAIAPIRAANGQVVAALGFAWNESHPFDRDDAVVVRTVTILCRQALERARLYDAEQQSRERLQRLQELTALLSRAVTLDDVLDVIAFDGIRLLGADRTRVLVPNAEGTVLDVVRAEDPGRIGTYSMPVDAPAVSAAAYRSGELVWVTTSEELVGRFPASPVGEEWTFAAVAAVPLVADGEVLAVWALGFLRPVALTDERRRLCQLFGEQAAQALRRAHHHAADALARQRAEERQEVAARLSQALTTADVAAALAEGAVTTFSATRGARDAGGPRPAGLAGHRRPVGLPAAGARHVGPHAHRGPDARRRGAADGTGRLRGVGRGAERALARLRPHDHDGRRPGLRRGAAALRRRHRRRAVAGLRPADRALGGRQGGRRTDWPPRPGRRSCGPGASTSSARSPSRSSAACSTAGCPTTNSSRWPSATRRAPRASRSAGTSTTSSPWPTAASPSWSATSSATASRPPPPWASCAARPTR